MGQLRIRVDLAPGAALGPGRIELLERVRDTGSISAAGRAMHMSYRRAWQLIDRLNHGFDGPVVEAHPGGAGGGGARLTDLGHTLIATYRAIEDEAEAAVKGRLAGLSRRLAAPAATGRGRRDPSTD